MEKMSQTTIEHIFDLICDDKEYNIEEIERIINDKTKISNDTIVEITNSEEFFKIVEWILQGRK